MPDSINFRLPVFVNSNPGYTININNGATPIQIGPPVSRGPLSQKYSGFTTLPPNLTRACGYMWLYDVNSENYFFWGSPSLELSPVGPYNSQNMYVDLIDMNPDPTATVTLTRFGVIIGPNASSAFWGFAWGTTPTESIQLSTAGSPYVTSSGGLTMIDSGDLNPGISTTATTCLSSSSCGASQTCSIWAPMLGLIFEANLSTALTLDIATFAVLSFTKDGQSTTTAFLNDPEMILETN